MLDEVELLVACLNSKVLSFRRLVCALCPKRWIGQDAVEPLAPICLVNRISEIDMWLDTMEIKIHQRHATRTRNQILPVICLGANALRFRTVENPLCLFVQPLVGTDKKTARTARRVTYLEIRIATRIGLHYSNDGLYKNSWREVLSGTFLTLARCFFQQAFESLALDIDIHRRPLFFVDHANETFEVYGIVESRNRSNEDIAE